MNELPKIYFISRHKEKNNNKYNASNDDNSNYNNNNNNNNNIYDNETRFSVALYATEERSHENEKLRKLLFRISTLASRQS